jgi:hypothetical protein
MNGKTVEPSPTAKLLGVIFNQELRWKEHVQQAIKRATKVSIALGGLRHLRPEQMHQLYRACVTPVVDYASTVWHDPLRDKTHLRHLNSVQRISLIRILSAFKGGSNHNPRSRGTHPSYPPPSPPPSPEHYRTSPRTPHLECIIASSET